MLGSLKVIENYTIQSGIHDFLLTFHSNHWPISHRFRDKWRYLSKITRKSQIFSIPVYLTPPLKGFPLELCIGAGYQETRTMGLSDGGKSFQIGLAVLIQYRSVTASQPATQPASYPASHVAVAITLNAKASSLKTKAGISLGRDLTTTCVIVARS